MIPVADALAVHIRLIKQFGGSTGVLDHGALSAALVVHFKLLTTRSFMLHLLKKPQLYWIVCS